jgi:hypothetical protein
LTQCRNTLTEEGVMEPREFRPQAEEFVVTEALAFKHAAVAMCEYAVFAAPSLVREVDQALSWFDCILGEPTLLFDINGAPAMHVFPVVDWHRTTQGRIFVAANKLWGSTILAIQTHSYEWDVPRAMRHACMQAVERYPGWIIVQVVPVVYDFPNVGVMAVVANPQSNARAKVIIDISQTAVIPENEIANFMHAEAVMDGYFAWSRLEMSRFYETEPFVEQWEKENHWALSLVEYLSRAGDLAALHGLQLCNWTALPAIENIMKAEIDCETYVAPVRAHYLMSKAGYCTVAVARMIASRYNVFDSESYVASIMGIPWPDPDGSSQWATATDELKYYTHRLQKPHSTVYADYTFLSNPTNYKNEILAERPANLRKWSIDKMHHSRLLGGIRICQKSFGQTVQLGLLSTTDPLSPYTMPQNWDKFDNTPLTSNGVVSTNLLIGGLVVVRD